MQKFFYTIILMLLFTDCHSLVLHKKGFYTVEPPRTGDDSYKSYLFGTIDSKSDIGGTISNCENGTPKVKFVYSGTNLAYEALASLGYVSPIFITWQTNQIWCSAEAAPVLPPRKEK